MVVISDGGIAGYTTGIGLRGHAVGKTADHIKALIAASPGIMGFFVPVREASLFRWLLANGYRGL
jgi:hypothetical protein